MSDFWLYSELGLHHVLDWNAYDHLLFLVVLCASYNLSSWKRELWLVTAFTLGHSLSLLLANYNLVKVSHTKIEFLIPVTILITALFNLFKKEKTTEKIGLLLVASIFFGLIHGMGFASFFISINDEKEILPLFHFAIGIEIAQIVIVLSALILAFIFQSIFNVKKRDWILVVSSLVIGLVIPMLINSWIF